MAALMLPANALYRQTRHCTTLKDFCYGDGASTPTAGMPSTGTPTGGTPTARMPGMRTPTARTPMVGTPGIMTPTNNLTAAPSIALLYGVRPPVPSCHTVTNAGFALLQADPFHLQDATPTNANLNSTDPNVSSAAPPLAPNRRTRRSKTLGAEISRDVCVSVVAPGGGTGINSSVYNALGRKDGFSVHILGCSRAAYDRYPACWASDGAPPPNLETFALDLLAQNCLADVDCLVVGSRGGQVVLPTLWHAHGEHVPPAIVMNGGCAMDLPSPVHWPEGAVTFLLLGGHDYFRDGLPMNEYVRDVQRRVPRANESTAVLLVHEMTHMPQAQLLTAILHKMIRASTTWKSTGCPPVNDFTSILASLRKGGWSGTLAFKTDPGDGWETAAFP